METTDTPRSSDSIYTEKLAGVLQKELNEKWPEVSTEVTYTVSEAGLVFILRIPNIKDAHEYQLDELRTARQAADFFRQQLEHYAKRKVNLLMSPRPVQHSDFRAPRFSGYEGSSWLYNVPIE